MAARTTSRVSAATTRSSGPKSVQGRRRVGVVGADRRSRVPGLRLPVSVAQDQAVGEPRRMRARDRRMRGVSPALVLTLAALGGAALLLFWASLTYAVVAKGELLPWDVGTVYQVEAFHRFTLYADGEARRAPDAVGGLLLAAIAGMSLLVYALLRRSGADALARTRRCFLALAAGTAYLAVDEMVGLHETVGYNLPALADIPGIDRPDDLIALAYAVPALAFLLVFLDVLLASRRAAAFFALAVFLFLVGAGLDAADVVLEELAEPAATISLLVGFLLLAVDRLAAAYTLREDVA